MKLDPNDLDTLAMHRVLSSARDAAVPSDPEAERLVLAASIQDARAVPLLAGLEPGDFLFPQNRTVFLAIRDLAAKGKLDPANLAGMVAFFRPGDSDLKEYLTADPVDQRLVGVYAERVRRAGIKRGVMEAARQALELVDADPGAGLERALAAIRGLSGRVGGQKATGIAPLREIALQVAQDALALAPRAMPGEATGLPVDEYMGGLGTNEKEGEYVIVAGTTNVGKSWFTQLLCYGWLHRSPGSKALILSTEMGTRAMAARMLATVGRTTVDALMCHRVGETAKAGLIRAANSIPEGLLLASTPGAKVAQVAEMVKGIPGLKVLVVDLVSGLSASGGGVASGYESLTAVSKELQALAKETGLCIIGTVQYTKASYSSGPDGGFGGRRENKLGRIKGTGSFYEDPDFVVLVLPGENPGEMSIELVKNRRTGKLGGFYCVRGQHGELLPAPASQGFLGQGRG